MLLRQAKVNYFKLKFDAASVDIKKKWKNLKYLINFNQQVNSFKEIKTDTVTLMESLNIANAFNTYYCIVAEKLDGEIPICNKSALHYMGASLGNSFFVSPSTGSEVNNIVNSFATKSCNLSKVSVYVYKQMSNTLYDIIAQLFNDWVQVGQFSECRRKLEWYLYRREMIKSKWLTIRQYQQCPA